MNRTDSQHSSAELTPAQIAGHADLALAHLLLAWRRQRIRRKTERFLHSFSDAMLRDIGLERGQIGKVAADLARKCL